MPRSNPYEPSQTEMSDRASNVERGSRLTLKIAVLRAQLIVGAIIIGVVVVAAVLLLVAANQKPQQQAMIPWIAFAVWLPSTALAMAWPLLGIGTGNLPNDLVPQIQQAMQSPEEPIDLRMKPFLDAWNRSVIARAALFEGAAVICLILWLISAEATLLLLVGVSLGLMLVTFPTVNRLCSWLEARIETLRS